MTYHIPVAIIIIPVVNTSFLAMHTIIIGGAVLGTHGLRGQGPGHSVLRLSQVVVVVEAADQLDLVLAVGRVNGKRWVASLHHSGPEKESNLSLSKACPYNKLRMSKRGKV